MAESGKQECFRHRVMSVGFNWRGGAIVGKDGWNTTKREFLETHLDASTEKELLKRNGIEKAS